MPTDLHDNRIPGAAVTVPFNDLGRALGRDRPVLDAAWADVVGSGWLVHGPHHRAFENELAAYLDVGHCLGVASGTDALELALRAVTSGRPGPVITVANAGGYATVAARAAGRAVRYVDVDPSTHCLDPEALASVIDPAHSAVVVTHLYGRMAPVEEVLAVCRPLGVPVVEDCAQAIGASQGAIAAGAAGDVAAFSFYPTKNLGALGDGGAVVTSSDALADSVRALRQYGWSERYYVTAEGGRNSRLDELQAAVLRSRLPGVDAGNARRREVIGAYARAAPASVRVLPAPDLSHAGHLAVVVTDAAADLAAYLARCGVGTSIHYPVPDHRQPAWSDERYVPRLPVTEGLRGRVLSLPCFPELEDAEVRAVCEGLADYARR